MRFIPQFVFTWGNEPIDIRLGIMLGSHKPEGPFTLEPGTFSAYVVSADVEGGSAGCPRAQRSTAANRRHLNQALVPCLMVA